MYLAGLGLPAVGIDTLGQTEVGDDGNAILGEEHVRRLEIAMDDSHVVSDLDCACQRHQELGGLPRRLGRPFQAVGQ